MLRAVAVLQQGLRNRLLPQPTEKGDALMYFYVVMLAIWLGMASLPVKAQEPPALPSDSVPVQAGRCIDKVSKKYGDCTFFISPSSGLWTVFAQNGVVQEIRNTAAPGQTYRVMYLRQGFGASL